VRDGTTTSTYQLHGRNVKAHWLVCSAATPLRGRPVASNCLLGICCNNKWIAHAPRPVRNQGYQHVLLTSMSVDDLPPLISYDEDESSCPSLDVSSDDDGDGLEDGERRIRIS